MNLWYLESENLSSTDCFLRENFSAKHFPPFDSFISCLLSAFDLFWLAFCISCLDSDLGLPNLMINSCFVPSHCDWDLNGTFPNPLVYRMFLWQAMLLKPEYMLRMFQKGFYQQLEFFIIIFLFKLHQKVHKVKMMTKPDERVFTT